MRWSAGGKLEDEAKTMLKQRRLLIMGVLVLLASRFFSIAATPAQADWGSLPTPRSIASEQPANDWSAHTMLQIHGAATSAPTGLSPTQIRAAYNLPSTGGTGTIAIIDAYDGPTVQSDLSVFSSRFGLPLPSSANFEKHMMSSTIPTDSGWALEISLDVQWAHAIAPNAKILLVEAISANNADLLDAVDYARNRPDVVAISMSWGESEFHSESTYDYHFNSVYGATFFASSGDNGAGVNWPAVSPNVVGVGGTTLTFSGGSFASETAWSESGGGLSRYEAEPSYQITYGVSGAGGKRAVPDVSYDANPSSGVSVYYGTVWYQVGGTSAGAPQWAAIQSLGLSASNNNFYQDAKSASYPSYFRDITSGSNGHPATTGYDLVTGLGSPLTTNYVPGTTPDFSISALPTTRTVVRGGSASYTITIAPLNGFSGSVTLSVSGLPPGGSGTFSPNPTMSSSSILVTTSTSTPTGTYVLTITGVSGSLIRTTTVIFIINVAPTVTTLVSSANPSVYGQSVNFIATVIPTGATGTVTFQDGSGTLGSITLSNGTAIYQTTALSAGSHNITAIYSGDTNFASSTSSPLTQTVDLATMAITAGNVSKTYGTMLILTAFATSGLVNEDTVISVTLNSTGTAAGAMVGIYDIVPSAAVGTGLSNYTISYVNGTLTVNKAEAIISVVPYNVTYDGNVHTATGNATGVFGESLPGLDLSGITHTAAGSYSDVWTFTDVTGNYNNASGSLTDSIGPKALAITAGNVSKTYGTMLILTAFATSGLVNEDTVISVTLNSTGTAAGAVVGIYDIVPSAAVGTGLSNYTISYVNGTLTANKAEAVISVMPYNVTYDGNAHTATGNVTGVFGESLPGLDLSGTTHTAAGSYSDVWTFTDVTGNYNNASGSLTDSIGPKALAITAGNVSKTYGTMLILTAFATSGLVNEDTVISVTLNSTGTAAGAVVGIYDVVPSVAVGTGLSNYNITYVSGALTVIPTTSLSVSPVSSTYGGTVSLSATLTSGVSPLSGKTITFTINGTVIGSATTDNSGVATLTGVSLAGISSGTHTSAIGASFAGDTSYSTSSGSADLTVSKASTHWGIIGGIIAAVVVVGAVFCLVVRRRRK